MSEYETLTAMHRMLDEGHGIMLTQHGDQYAAMIMPPGSDRVYMGAGNDIEEALGSARVLQAGTVAEDTA